jgi:hypothetical protein
MAPVSDNSPLDQRRDHERGLCVEQLSNVGNRLVLICKKITNGNHSLRGRVQRERVVGHSEALPGQRKPLQRLLTRIEDSRKKVTQPAGHMTCLSQTSDSERPCHPVKCNPLHFPDGGRYCYSDPGQADTIAHAHFPSPGERMTA